MPSVGFSEMLLIGLIALIVVGPKDLPLLMRKAGQFMNKLRSMAADFRSSFDELARQAELDELRKEVDALRRGEPLKDVVDPIREVRDEVMTPFDLGMDTDPPQAKPKPAPETKAETASPAASAPTAQGDPVKGAA